MSYNVTITRNTISPDDAKAWDELDVLLDQKNVTDEKGKDFLDLIEKLKLKFPCITTLSDDEIDNGVWSDGPLSNNAGKNTTTIGIVFSQVTNVMPFLIKTATENGFVVFDPQTGKISRPRNAKSTVEAKSENNIEKLKLPASFLKRFWEK